MWVRGPHRLARPFDFVGHAQQAFASSWVTRADPGDEAQDVGPEVGVPGLVLG
ncbi:siderophore-interacting protein [Dietzia sp. PP-33]|uniref:siderophore-interacting protein n=1 Tax=Dietzia sp. PP-33 TaxID=2957500 RepID=UPI0039AFC457